MPTLWEALIASGCAVGTTASLMTHTVWRIALLLAAVGLFICACLAAVGVLR